MWVDWSHSRLVSLYTHNSLSNLSCEGFTTNAWLTGLLALLIVPLFLTASANILTFFSLPEKRPFPYSWTVFTYLNAFAQKDAEYEPSRVSTRLIFLLMCLSSMITFNMFSASYTSFLSVVKVASPFSSIQVTLTGL